MNRDQLLSVLTEHELAHEVEAVAPYAHFEIALTRTEAPTITRLGGDPEVPPGFEWPCHRWPLSEVASWPDYALADLTAARAQGQVREEDGQLVLPLSFLMQVDLAEVRACDPSSPLPPVGRLLFFASVATDVTDPRYGKRVASAVRFVDGPSLAPMAQAPTTDSFPTRAIGLRPERRLHLDLPFEAQTELLERLSSDERRAFVKHASGTSHALLVATSDECVGPMPPPGEVALARIMDEPDVGLFIGDASWVTFVIPEADLAAGRWEAALASVFIG